MRGCQPGVHLREDTHYCIWMHDLRDSCIYFTNVLAGRGPSRACSEQGTCVHSPHGEQEDRTILETRVLEEPSRSTSAGWGRLCMRQERQWATTVTKCYLLKY